ncbi:hypothetical protein MBOT_14390 [Mycobacterium botniense]|uniref:Uncharacterized protein n=1 Tax=Mycobacterium botniense TaxID=84962 RepID=A0A7I9XWA7_9MYCO|nr:hypothetical protein MBOT_14390 [Mycobacterium botniense]
MVRGFGVGAAAAGLVVAAGATAPGARADILDVIIDPIIDPMMSALSAGMSDLGGAAAALGVGGLADVGSATSVSADPLGGVDAALVGVVQDLNSVVNGVAQDWITSPIGGPVDKVINAPFVLVFGRDLIGNGINDFTGTNDSLLGSSGLFGNLGDGGFLIGNGTRATGGH